MGSIKDVDSSKLIEKTAEELRKIKEIKPPEWSSYVKTGVHKERLPTQKDWWYTRSASVLRKVQLNNRIGVEKLRKIYGGRKNLGHRPEHKRKASGAIIRNILKQLEAAEFVKSEKGKGRVITPKGQSFLAKAARSAK
jgi:small subunit ribosomal protein S19e